jgi:serine phosphatase RsbU (regulator of sigma subunit)
LTNGKCSILFSAGIILLLLQHSIAQTPHIDSLLTVLKTLKEDTSKSNTLNEITRAYLFELNDQEKANVYIQQQITQAKKINYKKGLAFGYLNSGILYRTTGNYQMAHHYDSEALKIMQEIGSRKGESSCYGNIGMTYINQGNYKEGLEYSFKGLSIKQEIGDKRGVAISYNNIGAVYFDKGNYKEALTCYLKSLKIREELNDKMGISMSYNNIGNIFNSQNKLEAALAYYKKAVKIQEELGNKKASTNTYTNIGNVYWDQHNYKEAFAYHFKALKIQEASNDKKGIAISYNSIGADYLHMGKPDQALAYQLRSFALCKEIGYKRGLINASGGIGNLYEQQNKWKDALIYYDEMLAIAKELDTKEGIRDAYENFASVYKKRKDFDKALQYTQLLYEVKDSILNKENFKQVTELNTRYETEKKEKEILLLTKDQQLSSKILKEQQLVRWGLMGGMVLLFISIFSIYRRYRFKQKANLLLEKQKEEIQKQNVLITDSIDYARNIQDVVLPGPQQVKNLFPDYFIFYRPKSIVSGDFYWVNKVNDQMICAVADCTGHGVPGAFMSLLGYNMLENVIKGNDLIQPSLLLNALNEEVVTRFSQQQEKETVKHGMDIALITIDEKRHLLNYAGAHNSIYIIRKKELIELKANKQSIGFVGKEHATVFDNHSFELKKGDLIYLFTDGFPDQIGGPNRKKFYYQPFRDLLLSISPLPMEEQEKKLQEMHQQWMGNSDQTDDLLIMGIRY